MKKIILSLGVGLFLWAFATHVKVSVDSPKQLVTEEALVHASCETYYSGCWPECPLKKVLHWCPSGLTVYRCECGTGYCTPMDQELC